MDELTARAYRAYFMTAKREGAYSPDQPAASDSGPVSHNNKDYVVLRNINGILAVYRVRYDGILRRMRRWPKALENH